MPVIRIAYQIGNGMAGTRAIPKQQSVRKQPILKKEFTTSMWIPFRVYAPIYLKDGYTITDMLLRELS